jgi:hypothetical protein
VQATGDAVEGFDEKPTASRNLTGANVGLLEMLDRWNSHDMDGYLKVLIQSDTATNVGSNCNWQRLSWFSVNHGHNGLRFHYQA